MTKIGEYLGSSDPQGPSRSIPCFRDARTSRRHALFVARTIQRQWLLLRSEAQRSPFLRRRRLQMFLAFYGYPTVTASRQVAGRWHAIYRVLVQKRGQQMSCTPCRPPPHFAQSKKRRRRKLVPFDTLQKTNRIGSFSTTQHSDDITPMFDRDPLLIREASCRRRST